MKIRYHHLPLLVLSLAVTFLVYGDMLRLPLYLDDVILWRYVDQVSLGELFTRIDLVPYYRPASFVPWKLIMLAGAGFTASAFYAVNLVVHAVNGYLVGALAWKVFAGQDSSLYTNRWRLAGWLAALFYLLFPFSYQAVTWTSALGHLMTALGALVAANALEWWWRGGAKWPLPAIWLGVALAAFSHENGAVVPLLLCLPFVLSPQRRRAWRRALVPLLPTFAVVAVYMLVWFALPRARNESVITVAERLSSAVYYAQGMGYPVAQVGAALWKSYDLPREMVAGVLGVGGGLVALALAGRAGWYGVLWYAAGIGLSVLFLPYEYALGGPRLMLFASVGAALLWAAAIARVWDWRPGYVLPNSYIPKFAWFSLTLAIIITSGGFLAGRMALHRTMSGLYHAMLDEAERNPSAIFVNLPAWIAYRDETFALGSEGVTYMGEYVGFPDLIYVNRGEWTDNTFLSFDAVFPDTPDYWWDALRRDQPPDEIAALVRENGGGYALNVVGGHWVWENAIRGGAGEEGHAFANGMVLTQLAAQDTDPVQVQLSWRLEAPQPVTAFVHLVCDGALVGQSDGAPLRGLLTFESWPPGETWTETRYLAGAEAAGECAVRVGLYDPITGERVLTADGAEWVETAV